MSPDTKRSAILTALVSEALAAEVTSVTCGAALPKDQCFDLLMVDLAEGLDPLVAIGEVVHVKAHRRVLVAATCDLTLAKLAYARRFNGLITEEANRQMRIAILRLVMAGGEYFPWIKRPEGRQLDRPSIARLSKRQKEVLSYLTDGKTNKQIAEALGISIATVKLHVQGILGEAGARNRTEAVVRFGGLQDRG